MADALRLVALSCPPELAKEIARQIDAASGSEQIDDHEARIAALEDAMAEAIVTDEAP